MRGPPAGSGRNGSAVGGRQRSLQVPKLLLMLLPSLGPGLRLASAAAATAEPQHWAVAEDALGRGLPAGLWASWEEPSSLLRCSEPGVCLGGGLESCRGDRNGAACSECRDSDKVPGDFGGECAACHELLLNGSGRLLLVPVLVLLPLAWSTLYARSDSLEEGGDEERDGVFGLTRHGQTAISIHMALHALQAVALMVDTVRRFSPAALEALGCEVQVLLALALFDACALRPACAADAAGLGALPPTSCVVLSWSVPACWLLSIALLVALVHTQRALRAWLFPGNLGRRRRGRRGLLGWRADSVLPEPVDERLAAAGPCQQRAARPAFLKRPLAVLAALGRAPLIAEWPRWKQVLDCLQIFMYVFLAPLVKLSLRAFACDAHPGGSLTLVGQPSVDCAEARASLLPAAVPVALLYAAAPTASLALLFLQGWGADRKAGAEDGLECRGAGKGGSGSPKHGCKRQDNASGTLSSRVSILRMQVRPRLWWWPLAVVLRSVLLPVMPALASPAIALCGLLFVEVLYWIALNRAWPWSSPVLNRFDSALAALSSGTCIAAIAASLGDPALAHPAMPVTLTESIVASYLMLVLIILLVIVSVVQVFRLQRTQPDIAEVHTEERADKIGLATDLMQIALQISAAERVGYRQVIHSISREERRMVRETTALVRKRFLSNLRSQTNLEVQRWLSLEALCQEWMQQFFVAGGPPDDGDLEAEPDARSAGSQNLDGLESTLCSPRNSKLSMTSKQELENARFTSEQGAETETSSAPSMVSLRELWGWPSSPANDGNWGPRHSCRMTSRTGRLGKESGFSSSESSEPCLGEAGHAVSPGGFAGGGRRGPGPAVEGGGPSQDSGGLLCWALHGLSCSDEFFSSEGSSMPGSAAEAHAASGVAATAPAAAAFASLEGAQAPLVALPTGAHAEEERPAVAAAAAATGVAGPTVAGGGADAEVVVVPGQHAVTLPTADATTKQAALDDEAMAKWLERRQKKKEARNEATTGYGHFLRGTHEDALGSAVAHMATDPEGAGAQATARGGGGGQGESIVAVDTAPMQRFFGASRLLHGQSCASLAKSIAASDCGSGEGDGQCCGGDDRGGHWEEGPHDKLSESSLAQKQHSDSKEWKRWMRTASVSLFKRYSRRDASRAHLGPEVQMPGLCHESPYELLGEPQPATSSSASASANVAPHPLVVSASCSSSHVQTTGNSLSEAATCATALSSSAATRSQPTSSIAASAAIAAAIAAAASSASTSSPSSAGTSPSAVQRVARAGPLATLEAAAAEQRPSAPANVIHPLAVAEEEEGCSTLEEGECESTGSEPTNLFRRLQRTISQLLPNLSVTPRVDVVHLPEEGAYEDAFSDAFSVPTMLPESGLSTVCESREDSRRNSEATHSKCSSRRPSGNSQRPSLDELMPPNRKESLASLQVPAAQPNVPGRRESNSSSSLQVPFPGAGWREPQGAQAPVQPVMSLQVPAITLPGGPGHRESSSSLQVPSPVAGPRSPQGEQGSAPAVQGSPKGSALSLAPNVFLQPPGAEAIPLGAPSHSVESDSFRREREEEQDDEQEPVRPRGWNSAEGHADASTRRSSWKVLLGRSNRPSSRDRLPATDAPEVTGSDAAGGACAPESPRTVAHGGSQRAGRRSMLEACSCHTTVTSAAGGAEVPLQGHPRSTACGGAAAAVGRRRASAVVVGDWLLPESSMLRLVTSQACQSMAQEQQAACGAEWHANPPFQLLSPRSSWRASEDAQVGRQAKQPLEESSGEEADCKRTSVLSAGSAESPRVGKGKSFLRSRVSSEGHSSMAESQWSECTAAMLESQLKEIAWEQEAAIEELLREGQVATRTNRQSLPDLAGPQVFGGSGLCSSPRQVSGGSNACSSSSLLLNSPSVVLARVDSSGSLPWTPSSGLTASGAGNGRGSGAADAAPQAAGQQPPGSSGCGLPVQGTGKSAGLAGLSALCDGSAGVPAPSNGGRGAPAASDGRVGGSAGPAVSGTGDCNLLPTQAASDSSTVAPLPALGDGSGSVSAPSGGPPAPFACDGRGGTTASLASLAVGQQPPGTSGPGAGSASLCCSSAGKSPQLEAMERWHERRAEKRRRRAERRQVQSAGSAQKDWKRTYGSMVRQEAVTVKPSRVQTVPALEAVDRLDFASNQSSVSNFSQHSHNSSVHSMLTERGAAVLPDSCSMRPQLDAHPVEQEQPSSSSRRQWC